MESFDLELQSLGLEKIYLHDCGLTSAGSLGDYTKLVEVDLGGNQLSEVGFLSDIAANLTYLDLSGNLIKSEEELFFSQDADELYFLQDAVNMKVLLLDHIDLFNHQLSCVRNMKDLVTGSVTCSRLLTYPVRRIPSKLWTWPQMTSGTYLPCRETI